MAASRRRSPPQPRGEAPPRRSPSSILPPDRPVRERRITVGDQGRPGGSVSRDPLGTDTEVGEGEGLAGLAVGARVEVGAHGHSVAVQGPVSRRGRPLVLDTVAALNDRGDPPLPAGSACSPPRPTRRWGRVPSHRVGDEPVVQQLEDVALRRMNRPERTGQPWPRQLFCRKTDPWRGLRARRASVGTSRRGA